MRLPPAIVPHTEEVLREILRFTGPADVTLSRYFRENPKLGGRERGVIAEAVYGLLRNKSVFTNFAESGVGPMMRRMALLGLIDTVSIESIAGLSPEEVEWLTRTAQIDRNKLPLAMRANMPPWLLDKLIARDGEAAAMEMAAALNQPAPLDLRVNAIKANREDVMAALAAAPILCEATPYSPLGLRVIKSRRCRTCRSSRTAPSKCRMKAASCWPRSSASSAARWWSISALVRAARRWHWVRPCATPVACTPLTYRKSVWPSSSRAWRAAACPTCIRS